jgi:hypothetical protein
LNGYCSLDFDFYWAQSHRRGSDLFYFEGDESTFSLLHEEKQHMKSRLKTIELCNTPGDSMSPVLEPNFFTFISNSWTRVSFNSAFAALETGVKISERGKAEIMYIKYCHCRFNFSLMESFSTGKPESK